MSIRQNTLSTSRRLAIACTLMTLVLLVAGLWPFNPFPENQVTWLRTDKALEFGGHAVALSSHSVPAVHSNGRAFCSLEIRLQPRFPYLNNSGTLLVFYTPENPLQFRLMQYRDELLVRRDYRNDENQVKTVEIELEHVFTGNEPVSFAVTSGPAGSVAYRNGAPVGTSTRMGLSCNDFSGQLVLGNSPVSDDPWQGKLYGLAIYDRELTPEEVRRDFAAGAAEEVARQPDEKERVIARYGFAEGSGKIVHNTAGPAPDLHIPDVFRILHKKFLMLPSEESQDKLELRDILINIVGFIPFGFLLFAYLSWHTKWNRAAFLTILTGAAISLTIEVLQVFIPARSSGITDIITNTLGTFLGVLLFRWRRLQALE